MAAIKTRLNGGWVTARDRGDLEPGELQTATGIHYKPGDSGRAHKIGGRGFSSTNASTSKVETSATRIVGLYAAQFDSGGNDRLLAAPSAGSLYAKVMAQSGSFAAVQIGGTNELSSAQTNLSGAHYNNRHYLCNGVDRNIVFESDATARRMSMLPPQVAPTVAVSTATLVHTRPGAETATAIAGVAGWQNTAAAGTGGTDTSQETFAYVRVSASEMYAGAIQHEWHTWGADTNAGRRLAVRFRVTSSHVRGNAGEDIGAGGGRSGRFKVRAAITYSTDGTNYSNTLINSVYERSMAEPITVQVPITANSNLIKVKCAITALTKGDPVQLQIADIRIERGGAASNITATAIYYAFSEWDAEREQESAPSPVSDAAVMAGNNLNTLTLPSAAENSRSTHWIIYRTPDLGVVLAAKEVPLTQLGRIAFVPIAQTSYADTFELAYDIQATPVVPQLVTQAAAGQLSYPLHMPAPNCKQFFVHRGRLCGIPATSDRALAYSEPGLPESWPELNSDNDFPLQEGDRLVAGASVGDTLIMFCSTTVVTMLDVPSWTEGQFRATQKHTLRGAPGLVNQDAFAVLTAAGSPMVAWVSYQGIYMTDGHTAERISDDQQWNTIITAPSALSYCRLAWDRNRQCLVFAYDASGAGDNNRWALIHMAPEHRKANGQPKWTGPHYGEIVSMVSAMVSGTHRLWSGHDGNGTVYIEDNGTVDQSQAYSGTQVPLIVKTARLYGDSLGQAASWRDWSVYKANLRHTAAGGAETVTVAWTTGRDSSGVTQSVSKTPSIVSQQGNEFYVGLGGEWHEVQLTHTGSAAWALLDLRMEAQAMGRAGRVA